MNKKIIASNFKTNHSRQSTRSFINQVDFVLSENDNCEVIIFPSLTALDYFALHSDLDIGVQNCYPVKNGSFTGEVGSEQLEEFEVSTILIGHSERRHIIKESNELIIAKFNYFKNLGYKIIYCVGEPLEVRQAGLDATLEYIWSQFDGIDVSYENLIVAYEPVWAIGTGITATVQDIKEIHSVLKQQISKPLLYGGSVKLENLKEILKVQNVDGVLVGTASWDADDFCKMIEIANKGE